MSEENEVTARTSLVADLLKRKDKAGALAASLVNPPVNSKSEELKVFFIKVVGLFERLHFLIIGCKFSDSRKSVGSNHGFRDCFIGKRLKSGGL
jgi:hypothetical protein